MMCFLKRGLTLSMLVFGMTASTSLFAAGFAAVAPMKIARDRFTATLLPSGKVLVAGGQTAGNNPLSSAELYDPSSNSWTIAPSMQHTRLLHNAVLVKTGKVLVVGFGGAELYDPVSNTWSATAPESRFHTYCTANVMNNGNVFVFDASSNRPEIYDPINNVWFDGAAFMSGRAYHTTTVLANGKILITGGLDYTYGFGIFLNRCELYDPATDSVSIAAPMISSRIQHSATLLPNGKVLVVSGGSCELYTPDSGGGTWTLGPPMPFGYYGGLAASLLPNGQVLFTGGYTSKQAALYDYVSNSWALGPNTVNATLFEPSPAVLLPNGNVLIMGGFGGPLGQVLNSCEVYDSRIATVAVGGAYEGLRTNHTATLLPNGNVFVAAGQAPYFYGYPNSSDLYSPSTNSWSAGATLVSPRVFHSATLLLNGKVLLAGGFAYDTIRNDGYNTELYDPITDSSTGTQNLLDPRWAHTATLLPTGKVLLTGGKRYGSNSINSCELYDSNTNSFSSAAILKHGRSSHTATLLSNGKVLVAGGEPADDNGISPVEAELYDGVTNTWTSAGRLTTSRYLHTATLLANGKVLITGGIGDESVPLSSSDLYDPVTNTWSLSGTMTVERAGHTATLLSSGKVLFIGGFGGPTADALSSTELYNPATNTFESSAPLAHARYFHTATRLNNDKVLIIGGQDVSLGAFGNPELFDSSLGFQQNNRPVISSVTTPLINGTPLILIGSQLKGISESSNSQTNASATNYPLVKIQSLETGQIVFLSPNPNIPFDGSNYTSLGTPSLPVGYAAVTVIANGIPSVSSVIAINKATTNTQINSIVPTSSVVGQTVTISFTVTPTPVGAPLGNVIVGDGSTSVIVPANSGTATLAFPTAGTRTLSVTYPGDQNTYPNAASTSFTVNKADTTVTIGSYNPSTVFTGKPVSIPFNVAVNDPGVGIPTGTVTVGDGTVNSDVDVSAGSVTLTFSSAGNRTITATYSGDTRFNTGVATKPITVQKIATTAVAVGTTYLLNSTANLVRLNALVNAAGGATVNQGIVTFSIFDSNNILLGNSVDSATLTNGLATVDYPLPLNTQQGSYTILVSFKNSTDFDDSTTTAALSLIGNTDPNASVFLGAITASRNPARVGVPVTFSVSTDATGDPNNVTYQWRVYSKAGNTLSILPPLESTPTITRTFSSAETYIVKVDVSNGAASSKTFDYVAVSLDPNPNGIGANIADNTDDANNAASRSLRVGDSVAGVIDFNLKKSGLQARSTTDFNINIAGRSDYTNNSSTALKFTQSQIVIIQAKDASGAGNAVVAQRMLAISQNEIEQNNSITLPTNRTLRNTTLATKFNFKAAPGKRLDTLTFSASFSLPGGLDFSNSPDVYFGIGNAIIKVKADIKGNGTSQPPDYSGPSLVSTGVKSFALLLPQSNTGLTAVNSDAVVKMTMTSTDLVANGFGFLGVTNGEIQSKSVKTECLLIVGGVTYRKELIATYKASKGTGILTAKASAGQ